VTVDDPGLLARMAEITGSTLLGVPPRGEVRVILPIGVPLEQWSQKEKKSFAERAWFNGWPAAPASRPRTGL
jgi:hypothetical protein